jgi:hypothetical protein
MSVSKRSITIIYFDIHFRLSNTVLGSRTVHRRVGTVHWELLLGRKHLLPPSYLSLPSRIWRSEGTPNQLLSVGAVCVSARSAHVLCAMHNVEGAAALAFRYESWGEAKIFEEVLGINVQSLTQMACDARMMDADARAATVQTIAGHMEDALEIQREVVELSRKVL